MPTPPPNYYFKKFADIIPTLFVSQTNNISNTSLYIYIFENFPESKPGSIEFWADSGFGSS
jgi:hypothetical protein